ncbi:MAG: S-layer homology domain-containing protein, partial [Pyrinomonadaceae bacterium]|nr:S-layer homology domain-containing protein [Pyrinomonadaceae bacterium]
ETQDGNTIGILLTAPDGTKYSSGIALPILDGRTRQVVVNNPQAGAWLLEARGVRGLAALPNVSLPTSGAAAPGPVDGTITQKLFTLDPVQDVRGHPAQAQIENALKNRQMDTFADGMFHPDDAVTREDFARILVLNTPLRQSLGSSPRFADVSGDLAAIAEAVTANGSTTRDFNYAPSGMMSATGNTFNPSGRVSRLAIAVALVRALGLDAEAQALSGQPVTISYQGQTLVVADNANIPSELRGYVQIALNKGILQASVTQQQGPLTARVDADNSTTRAILAYALDSFRQRFVAGN